MAKAKGSEEDPIASRSDAQSAKSTKASGVRKSNRAKKPSVQHELTTMTDLAKPPSTSFPVVGIGASAGGLEALEVLLRHMPADTGMAFVVLTHQHPGHASLLPELLSKLTKMPIAEAADGMKLEPNHIYIGPPGGQLAILNRTLHRMEMENKESPRLPIDYFFRSLATDQKEHAICIVLSGTGTDGTLGLKAIKGESGMAIVQQPQSAKYAGMPSSAIATGLADFVLTPEVMPSQLVAYSQGPYFSAPGAPEEWTSFPEESMQKIFILLRNRTGHDFSAYKSNTMRRRIERRMNVNQIKQPNDYVHFLEENSHEIDVLFNELLISVTSFFRDPDAWEALAPLLTEWIKSRPENYTLRAWVPGCATGEEAFSLAVLLRECMEKVKRYLDVQIFATDLDSNAIEVARSGRFPEGIAVDVASERLERHFTRDESAYRIRKEIREMTIFATQNLIKDPPFTKLDILSCRNLLIYLNADLQKRVLPIFHYALKPGGLLFLGTSETIGSHSSLFETVDKRWKIFRRKESSLTVRDVPELPTLLPKTSNDRFPAATIDSPAVKAKSFAGLIERMLLGRFAPASVVVNDRGEILFIHGHTGAYLEPAQGEPRNNVFAMARQGLEIELAAAVRECNRLSKEVTREGVRVKSNGEFIHVDLVVTKIDEPESVRGLLLITLRPTQRKLPQAAITKRPRTQAAVSKHIEQLERELQYLQQSHQSTLEELETSNEELKSSNEELQSTNEELQSTNEELETSKEEMQSLNEELTTVNAELQSKVDDLSQSNDDMKNLLNSTDIATVFLDNDLNIMRFTEQTKSLVMLRPTDVGRPISELASNLDYTELVTDCRNVLNTLVFKESEVRTRDGVWYLMRIMPYRTIDNVIDGLVLTFVDISRLKAGERERAFFESIVNTVREPLIVLDTNLRVVSANQSFYRTFQTAPKQTIGELIYQFGASQWDLPKFRELLESVLLTNTAVENYEVEIKIPNVGKCVFLLNARRLDQATGQGELILLALEDARSNAKEVI